MVGDALAGDRVHGQVVLETVEERKCRPVSRRVQPVERVRLLVGVDDAVERGEPRKIRIQTDAVLPCGCRHDAGEKGARPRVARCRRERHSAGPDVEEVRPQIARGQRVQGKPAAEGPPRGVNRLHRPVHLDGARHIQRRGRPTGRRRQQHIVGVEQDHDVAAASRDPGTRRCCLPAVRSEQRGHLPAEGAQHLVRFVARAVVDHDHLDGRIVLGEGAVQRLAQEAPVVVVGDDHADERGSDDATVAADGRNTAWVCRNC